jgi:hypothetical protein
VLGLLSAGRANCDGMSSWAAMWQKPDGQIGQVHWETHHEVNGVYQEVHIGQPAGGAADPCQMAHEGHLL